MASRNNVGGDSLVSPTKILPVGVLFLPLLFGRRRRWPCLCLGGSTRYLSHSVHLGVSYKPLKRILQQQKRRNEVEGQTDKYGHKKIPGVYIKKQTHKTNDFNIIILINTSPSSSSSSSSPSPSPIQPISTAILIHWNYHCSPGTCVLQSRFACPLHLTT